MKLYLIRHGMTAANEKRLYCGSTDVPLSENGAKLLQALKLSRAYPDPSGKRLISSGMLRCEQTLSILFGDAPHEAIKELSEIDFGAFELHSYEELKNDPDYLNWITDAASIPTPGGESGNMMKARVLGAFDKITARGEDAIIVTHGGVIAAFMERLFPGARANRYEWQPRHGEGFEVDLEKREFRAI